MPILRKVIKVGNSRAVTIPDDWFEYQEKVFGNDVKEVAMEVDKDTITIRPLPNNLYVAELEQVKKERI